MGELATYAIITWLIFIPIAFANGIIRERLYKSKLGDLRAHQVSTVIASLAFLALSYYMIGWIAPYASTVQLLLTGLLMVYMTIIFEFGFGHYAAGKSWKELLGDYNIKKGRVWGLFLVVILFAPLLFKYVG